MSGELKPLIEHLAPRKFDVIQEKAEGNNWMLVRGLIQREGEKNGNGRIYDGVFSKALSDSNIVKRLNSRGMTGVVEHPDSGQTHLMEVSHVVTKAWMEGKDVLGEILVLDTAPGVHIQKLFRAGIPVGISSRGRGSSFMKDGAEYVEASSYVLDTWDFVSTPSVDGAFPRMAESLQGPYLMESSMDQKIAEIMRLHVRAHEIGTQISGADIKTLDRLATELIESESKITTLVGQKVELKADADKALTVIRAARDSVTTARDKVYTETAATFASKVNTAITTPAAAGTAPALAGAELLAETFARLQIADKRIAEMSAQISGQANSVPLGKFESAKKLAASLLSSKLKSEATLASVRAENAELKKKHASAFALLEAFVARNDEAKLLRRKREALADNPGLEKYREILDRCATVTELDQMIESLAKALGGGKPAKAEGAAADPAKAASKPSLAKVGCTGCNYVTEAEVGAGEIQCPQCGKQKLAPLTTAAKAPAPAFESALPKKDAADKKEPRKAVTESAPDLWQTVLRKTNGK